MCELGLLLEAHRQRLNFPALAAAVVRTNHIIAAGAVGERKLGSGVRVTLEDRFHFGSCTKSITALLAVDLLRQRRISLTNTVGQLFPEWRLDPDKASITLDLLLQNRSGLSATPAPELWSRAWNLTGTAQEQRISFLREYLQDQPLEAKPGTASIYSNAGFSLAGAMLEKRIGTAWESLVFTNICGPLHLTSAGFGAPAASADTNQPWGHQYRGETVTPVLPADNPSAIAPAAAVHLSVLDAARYAAFHLAAARGEIAELLEYRDQLYQPAAGSEYAFGWMVQQRTWAQGKVIFHAGSNTMFYTIVWIAPARDFAIVTMTNLGDPNPERIGEKCDEVVGALIEEFLR